MPDEEIQRATAVTTEEYKELKKKADMLDFLFGEDGIRVSNLEKVQIWREKAEQWEAINSFSEEKMQAIRNHFELLDSTLYPRAWYRELLILQGEISKE